MLLKRNTSFSRSMTSRAVKASDEIFSKKITRSRHHFALEDVYGRSVDVYGLSSESYERDEFFDSIARLSGGISLGRKKKLGLLSIARNMNSNQQSKPRFALEEFFGRPKGIYSRTYGSNSGHNGSKNGPQY